MKIVLKIVVAFLLGISMLIGLLFTFTNNDNAEEMESSSASFGMLSTLATAVGQGSTIGNLPTPEDFRQAVYIDALFFIACLVGIVFTILNKKNGGLIAAAIVAVLAALFYFFQPSFDGTAFQDDNTDKVFALWVAIAAMLAAGLLVFQKIKFSEPAPSKPDALA